MKLKPLPILALAALLVWPAAFAEEKYQLDPAHTTIGFAIEHLVIAKVRGQFRQFTGTITYEPAAELPVRAATVTIHAASIDTGIQQRDDHLRSADFFDVEKYPQLSFETTRIEKRGNSFVATGNLSIHGVTRTIELPFTLKGPIKDLWGGYRIGIEARTTINRKDYGLAWNKLLETGGLAVGETVEIEIHAEAVKTEPKK
jgi:polyisoprenoid-binding protein YceI